MMMAAINLYGVATHTHNSSSLLAQEGRKLGYATMHGIPMRASSPVRHDSPLNQYGHEVTSYQPPWKALSEFALHSDFEAKCDATAHNPQTIQNLVNQVSFFRRLRVGTTIWHMVRKLLADAWLRPTTGSSPSYAVRSLGWNAREQWNAVESQ